MISDKSSTPIARPILPKYQDIEPYLKRIDQTRIYSNHGPLVLELEQRLSTFFGLPNRHTVTCSSGTIALIGAALAVLHRLPPTKRVCLVPAFSFVATASAANICGFETGLVDIDPVSWALDPETLRNHPRLGETGLVIPVAPFGRAIDLAAWQRFSEDTGISVVVDAAAGFEWLFQNQTVVPPDVTVVLSLHATKSFSSGEGGLILTRNEQFAMDCVRAVNHGLLGSRSASIAGLNGKMSEYHAAVALAELDGWSSKKQKIHDTSGRYQEFWAATPADGRLWTAPDIAGCYALFEAPTAKHAAEAAEKLAHQLIETRFWYGTGLQDHAAFRLLETNDLSATNDVATRVLGLPCFPDIEPTKIRQIVEAISN